jgi:predicted nucleic acid-binding protein
MEHKPALESPIELLADSDFFIALYRRNGTNHERSLRTLQKIEREGKTLALSVLVYAEITTVLAQRVSKATAHHFMHDVETAGIRLLPLTLDVFEKAQTVFKNQRSKNVSFTDAANIALARAEGFQSIVSFDVDYRKNSLTLFR